MTESVKIAILLAVHNRWKLTEALLNQLDKAPPPLELFIYVTDDGSVDATQKELSGNPNVFYQRTNGELYWAKSMKLAEISVRERVDYVMWLNNDVILSEDFFSRILNSIKAYPDAILVGQTCDAATQQLTYGGLLRIGRHPHRLQKIDAREQYEIADTFCGNIVLIPQAVNSSLGGIDGYFEHGYADYDYGYRAKNMGKMIRIIPGFLGTCSLNDTNLALKSNWQFLKTLNSIKYLPIRSQIRFCKRHGGLEWPVYVLSPYIRAILKLKRFRSNRITAGFEARH